MKNTVNSTFIHLPIFKWKDGEFCEWLCRSLLCSWSSHCMSQETTSVNPLSLHSYSRTSQMSWEPISPCTWTRSCSSCPCLSQPAGAVCAPCPSLSRPPSVLQASSSSGRGTPCRLSILYAQGQWRSSKTTLCWPYWVSQSNRIMVTDRDVDTHVNCNSQKRQLFSLERDTFLRFYWI